MTTIAAIVAFHRNKEFIQEAVASVLDQTLPVDEIIVVDDASPTGAEELSRLPASVRIIRHEHNLGIGGSRQTGVVNSTSDILAFLDGDDLWEREKIAKQFAFLRAHPDAALVHTGTVTFLRDGTVRPFIDRPPVLDFAHQLRWNHVLIQTAMMPRETVFATGGFRASRRFVPDWDFAIRVLANGGVIRAMPEALTRVRRWDHGNISSSGLRQMRRRIATITEHWPVVRRELGLRGGVESIAGIVEDEGGKVGHRLGGLWRGCAGVIRTLARLLPTAAILLTACGGSGTPSRAGPAITVSTVDGITTVTHTVAALERTPTVRPGAVIHTLGGLDADEDHDATPMTAGWLVFDGFITLHRSEAVLRRFDPSGALLARYGRRGEGPDAFLALVANRIDGDSIALLDRFRQTATTVDGNLVPGPRHRFDVPRSGTISPAAAIGAGLLGFSDGRGDTAQRASGSIYRPVYHLLVNRPGEARWDTLVSYLGALSYPVMLREDGQDVPGERAVGFGPVPLVTPWRDFLVVVENTDHSIRVHDADGTLRIRSLAVWPLRPVTAALREAQVAAEVAELAEWNIPPSDKASWTSQAREQQFTDSVAPYDRILAARDGALWLREYVTPFDTVEYRWLGFGRDGQLVRRLIIPARVQLLDIDRDRVLLRRTDDDGIGYIELRQLRGQVP